VFNLVNGTSNRRGVTDHVPSNKKGQQEARVVKAWFERGLLNDLKAVAQDNDRSVSAELRCAVRSHVLAERRKQPTPEIGRAS
jgi:hypothetical protein